jgi:hypothetical protein
MDKLLTLSLHSKLALSTQRLVTLLMCLAKISARAHENSRKTGVYHPTTGISATVVRTMWQYICTELPTSHPQVPSSHANFRLTVGSSIRSVSLRNCSSRAARVCDEINVF